MFIYDQLFTHIPNFIFYSQSPFILFPFTVSPGFCKSGLRHLTKPRVLLARPNHLTQLFLKCTRRFLTHHLQGLQRLHPFQLPDQLPCPPLGRKGYPTLGFVLPAEWMGWLQPSLWGSGPNGWSPKQPAILNICSQNYFMQPSSININQPSLASFWAGHMSTTSRLGRQHTSHLRCEVHQALWWLSFHLANELQGKEHRCLAIATGCHFGRSWIRPKDCYEACLDSSRFRWLHVYGHMKWHKHYKSGFYFNMLWFTLAHLSAGLHTFWRACMVGSMATMAT